MCVHVAMVTPNILNSAEIRFCLCRGCFVSGRWIWTDTHFFVSVQLLLVCIGVPLTAFTNHTKRVNAPDFTRAAPNTFGVKTLQICVCHNTQLWQ